MFTHSLTHLNGIIIQLPQDWMAPVKVRLSECCRPTRTLGYANADSGKLVNWTTGAYGWLVSRRSIYQQLCETRRLHHLIASLVFASTLGGVRSGNDQKWAMWHSVIFLALSIPRHSTTGHFHPLQHPSSGRLVWRFAFDSRKPDGRASELYVALREQSGEGQSPFRLTLWLLNSNRLLH